MTKYKYYMVHYLKYFFLQKIKERFWPENNWWPSKIERMLVLRSKSKPPIKKWLDWRNTSMSMLIRPVVSRKEWFQGGISRSSQIWFMMDKDQEKEDRDLIRKCTVNLSIFKRLLNLIFLLESCHRKRKFCIVFN